MRVLRLRRTMNIKIENNVSSASLKHVFEMLDKQEQISLVFLMCDDPVKAHCILTKNICDSLESNQILPDLVSYLAKSDMEFIHDKILESLILIKNYEAVEQLGYRKSDIPNLKTKVNAGEKTNINSVRKALLVMCENMTDQELTCLIGLIENDFKIKDCYFNHSSDLMEINLLYLIYNDYISDGTSNKECNLKNLISHLRKMNKHELANELEKVNDTNFSTSYEKFQNIMSPDNDFVEKLYPVQVASKHVIPFDKDRYDMDKDNMGLCLIINQRDFSEEVCLKNGNVRIGTRHGTNCDRDMLEVTFTGLGYHVKIQENVNSIELPYLIRQIVKQDVLKKHSSFVLCILTHGKKDEVYGVDGIGIPVQEIEKIISGDQCPQLLGKPKIIFIQACQGNDFQKALAQVPDVEDDDDDDINMPECDGPTNSVILPKCPPTADILTFWATVPGFASFRFLHSGSVFIQKLCAHLLKHGDSNHLEDIVRIVNDQLSKTHFGEESHVSMPQVKHTITKKLYFPYNSQNRLKAAQMLYLKFLFEELVNRCIVKLAAILYFKKNQKKSQITK